MKNRLTIVVVLMMTLIVVAGLVVVQSRNAELGGAGNIAPEIPTLLVIDEPTLIPATSTVVPPTRADLPPTWTPTPTQIPPTLTSLPPTETPIPIPTEIDISTLSATELYELGVEAFWNQDSDDAELLFSLALQRDDEFAEAYAYRGSVYRSHIDLELAADDYRIAEELAPDNPIVLTELARWYSFNANYQLAIDYAERAVTLDPNSLLNHYNLARVYWNAYDYENAYLSFENALQLDDYRPVVISDYAAFLHDLGASEDAIVILEGLIEAHPDFVQSYLSLGYVYRTTGRHQDALNVYKHIEEIDSNSVVGIIEQGITFESYIRDSTSSMMEYERAISIDPQSAKAYTNLGLVHLFMGNSNLALNMWDRAVEVDPNYYNVYYNRANFLDQNIDVRQAEEDYLRTIELNPRFHQAYLNLGNLYRKQSRYDESIHYYDNAIVVFPQFWLAYLNRGQTYSEMGDSVQAVLDYQMALSFNSNYSKIYSSLGAEYIKLEKYDLALDAFHNSIKYDVTYLRGYYELGQVYDLLGDTGKAQEYYQKAEDYGYNG